MFFNKIKGKSVLIGSILLLFSAVSYSQNITTAGDFFKKVSTYYSTIKDYEASVDITADRLSMSGKVSFKRPDLLRIDFTKPDNQVIVFNGELLTIYLPDSSAVLQQQVKSDSGAGGASLATPQGLSLMSRYYTVAYEKGQDPEPIDDNSDEKVVKLILYRRNSSEAFRYIKLAVNPDSKLIRRVEAVTPHGESFIFYFYNYALNQNIPDMRFVYDAPSSANNYNNFLFSE